MWKFFFALFAYFAVGVLYLLPFVRFVLQSLGNAVQPGAVVPQYVFS